MAAILHYRVVYTYVTLACKFNKLAGVVHLYFGFPMPDAFHRSSMVIVRPNKRKN
jgi:hypothetical protein